MSSPLSNAARLKIGIVGLNFGRHIINEICSGDAGKYFELQAVCDIDAAKAADFGQRLGVVAYTDLAQLLADPSVQIVGLFTGPVGRADLLRRIIRAGKDVVTTKPFELDAAAAREVLEEAQSLGRIILLNSPSPEPPDWMKLCFEWQQKYDLGRPVGCRAEVVVSYREQADGTWYDDPARCPAPPVFRLGIYLINDLVRLFGGVEKVQILSTRVFTGRPTADNAQLSLVFKNQALGSIYASFCIDDGQYYANALILHYERGTIYKNIKTTEYGRANLNARMSLVAKSGEKEVATQEVEVIEPESSYQWEVFYHAFTAGERGTESTPMPVDDIVHGVAVIGAMARAEQSKQLESV